MEYLSKDEVISKGTEFAGEVCYSGEYGLQVYTKDDIDGGVPVEGILYERYKNGNLCYYAFYHEGIPNGLTVRFYESGKVQKCYVMDTGMVDGEYTEWYENGNVKLKKYCKYGFVLNMQEFDIAGNLIEEKKELTESEKISYEKMKKFYEDW